jgi:hypothetical protein
MRWMAERVVTTSRCRESVRRRGASPLSADIFYARPFATLRSMTQMFSGVIGHEMIRRLLQSSAQDPAPAYLLTGPAHVGKRFIAEQFVAALLEMEHGASIAAHPDYFELRPEEGKTQVSVEQVRALKERVSLRPMRAKRQVAFLPVADRLNESGMNALLKVIEEPPAGAVFVLIAEDVSRIPATVRSRCVVLPFGIVAREDIEHALQARGVLSPEAAERAQHSRGRPGIALQETETSSETSAMLEKLVTAKGEGQILEAIEDLAKWCESSEDVQAAWRGAIQQGMELVRARFLQQAPQALRFGLAFVAAWRAIGSPISPRVALEAGCLQPTPRLPGHLPNSLPLVYTVAE